MTTSHSAWQVRVDEDSLKPVDAFEKVLLHTFSSASKSGRKCSPRRVFGKVTTH